MSKYHKRSGRGLMTVGLLLLAAAAGLAVFNIRETARAAEDAAGALAQISVPEVQQNIPTETQDITEVEIPDYLLNPNREMPVQTLNGEDYIGVLEIPSLQLKLPVLAGWSDAMLKKAPCRYSGSVYTDDMVLAGHNYKTHFGPLRRISVGDKILFTDAEGYVFHYRTVEVAVLDATAVEEMKSENPGLTLFTCTLGGRARFAVRAMIEE